MKKPIRLFRDAGGGLTLYVGDYLCRVNWRRHSRYGNGRRWFSGWHNWREEFERSEREGW